MISDIRIQRFPFRRRKRLKLVHADLRKAFCEQFSAEKEISNVENEEKYGVASGYRFYLEMIRSRDGRAIRFANEG